MLPSEDRRQATDAPVFRRLSSRGYTGAPTRKARS
jgi:hypothetical protein